MKTLTAAKKQITADWLRRFPELGEYRPLHLLRRVGPILEGVLLERTSGNDVYRPTFHVHCLVSESETVSLVLAHVLRTEKTRAPDDISVRAHEARYVEASRRLSEQSPLALSGHLRLAEVINAYRAFLNRPGIHYDANLLCGEMARICAWSGEMNLAKEAVLDGAAAMERWPREVAKQVGGMEAWRERLSEAIADPGRLRALADGQAQLLGAEALPRAELINVKEAPFP